MKRPETEENKIQKICDLLRKETLEPAKKESEKVVAEAQQQAAALIAKARCEAEVIVKEAREQMHRERNAFDSSLQRAASHSIETLRQMIDNELFNGALYSSLEPLQRDHQILSRLIDAIVAALHKEGMAVDLVAYVAANVSPEAITALLAEKTLERIGKSPAIIPGPFAGGVQVRLCDKKMTIDITDTALRELLASFVRRDYRKLFFTSNKAKEEGR